MSGDEDKQRVSRDDLHAVGFAVVSAVREIETMPSFDAPGSLIEPA